MMSSLQGGYRENLFGFVIQDRVYKSQVYGLQLSLVVIIEAFWTLKIKFLADNLLKNWKDFEKGMEKKNKEHSREAVDVLWQSDPCHPLTEIDWTGVSRPCMSKATQLCPNFIPSLVLHTRSPRCRDRNFKGRKAQGTLCQPFLRGEKRDFSQRRLRNQRQENSRPQLASIALFSIHSI